VPEPSAPSAPPPSNHCLVLLLGPVFLLVSAPAITGGDPSAFAGRSSRREGAIPTGPRVGATQLRRAVIAIADRDYKTAEKPAGQWCKYCVPGKGGCSIYAERPLDCRTFNCQWLLDPELGDHWYPARAKMVTYLFRAPDGIFHLDVRVDPAVPLRWQEEPYYSDIKRVSLAGVEGKGTMDGKQFWWRTCVVVGSRRIPIRPDDRQPSGGL
jgi:hypothetical protein